MEWEHAGCLMKTRQCLSARSKLKEKIMEEQKPSIGRIVHVANESGYLCAAIVTSVHSETCINVTRFNIEGSSTHITSLIKVEGEPKESIDWNWPPRV